MPIHETFIPIILVCLLFPKYLFPFALLLMHLSFTYWYSTCLSKLNSYSFFSEFFYNHSRQSFSFNSQNTYYVSNILVVFIQWLISLIVIWSWDNLFFSSIACSHLSFSLIWENGNMGRSMPDLRKVCQCLYALNLRYSFNKKYGNLMRVLCF
jgi:hypothetical protein